MLSEPNFGASAMEGKGAYNRHARLQAEGIALALPCIERVVETLEFDTADRLIIMLWIISGEEFAPSDEPRSQSAAQTAWPGSTDIGLPYRPAFERLQLAF
jgi:hypothetical protein